MLDLKSVSVLLKDRIAIATIGWLGGVGLWEPETVYLRLLARKIYSTCGPIADTGGLSQNQAKVIYRCDWLEELLSAELEGGRDRPLPRPGAKPPTERP